MAQLNPFAIVKASDYTDEQINSLWVELGHGAIEEIIDPRGKISKLILGGKGTGKTHLLRYLSYPVTRLRSPNKSGVNILQNEKFLGIFLRATGMDAARFSMASNNPGKWQQLFGIYLELRLVESLLHALCDIKKTSPNEIFNDQEFVEYFKTVITSPSFCNVKSVEDFHIWITNERKNIDQEVNNAAFTGELNIHVPFSIGSICIPINKALHRLHTTFVDLPLVYLIDEIENLSKSQQQVINSLIRYGESQATFRVTGRLYALKTNATLADGESNRPGSEYKTVILDTVLREHVRFVEFAKSFIKRRLAAAGQLKDKAALNNQDPSDYFDSIDNSNFFANPISRLGFDNNKPAFKDSFTKKVSAAFSNKNTSKSLPAELTAVLTDDVPILIQKLNLLRFAKKYKKHSINEDLLELAHTIKCDSQLFLVGSSSPSYKTAYNHYANDLFAQLCRESKKEQNVPYAGFDSFVKMSSGNPRNLLIILEKAYSIAAFRKIDFINKPKLSIEIQTQAASEAANFVFEIDTNFGTQTDDARIVTNRIATLLRTARYSLNIPEVSPLTFSFTDEDLSTVSRSTLNLALNYSFIFEVDGRPDRNSQKVLRKLQLNPLLAPRWGLPLARRGDISLSSELLNSIFDPDQGSLFDHNLKLISARWDNPFRKRTMGDIQQEKLF